MFKLNKNAMKKRDKLESKDLRLSLIRSRNVTLSASKRKSCVRKNASSCSKTLRTKSSMKLSKLPSARRELGFLWLKLLKLTRQLLNSRNKEKKRRRIWK